MKKAMICLVAAFTILSATSCGGDAGTKGTGSAGVVPGGDAGTKGTGSAGVAPGGDAGTKGTGSAGVVADTTVKPQQ